MKFVVLGAAPLLACSLAQEPSGLEKISQNDDAVIITGPTVIAFFPPVSQREVDADPDLNEVLADFQWHLYRAREELEQLGVTVHELYKNRILISDTGREHVFSPDTELGYYMVSPGREALVIYGGMTDVDLIYEARGYFGVR